jgi:RNA polymerase sigma-70 factor (ECF subfamily)
MLADIHDAEDVAQDTMLKGLLKITELHDGIQFGRWVLRIAGNLCIDLLRKQKRVKTAASEHLAHPQQTARDPALREPNENHDLRGAIGRLPRELRIPLVMYYFENKNAKAIAERLNISHSGACQRIRTARQQLHELLTRAT